jgi:hypothetical protein
VNRVSKRLWRHALGDLAMASAAYVLSEWLFFVTKPSFMSLMTWPEKMLALSLSLWVVFGIGTAGFLIASVLALSLGRWPRAAFEMLTLPAAMVLTLLSMLMIDNFTYTVFGFGLATLSVTLKIVYLTAAAFALIRLSEILAERLQRIGCGETRSKARRVTLACLTLFGLYGLSAFFDMTGDARLVTGIQRSDRTAWPNVVFFAADGVEAERLAMYGAHRDPTPFLSSIAAESLVVRNPYSNCSRSTGSITSMLTGMYPTTSKVFYPPHAYVGFRSFLSLPAMLKAVGYRSLQETVRYYTDGPDLNMRLAFDEANQRHIGSGWQAALLARIKERPKLAQTYLFIENLQQRAVERMMHVLLLPQMSSALDAVMSKDVAKVYGFSDNERIDRALRFARESGGQPFFIHLHLMDTHCCEYAPAIRKFSKQNTKPSDEVWKDLYDDAILESDQLLMRLVSGLRELGQWDNTILIYSSDHSAKWDVLARVPLIIRFPHGQPRGIRERAQLLDVAPTILEYLGVSPPPWMEGASFLEGPADLYRPLFSVGGMDRNHFRTQAKDVLAKLVGGGPPTYGMRSMVMSVCNRWYRLDLDSDELESGHMPFEGTCDPNLLPTHEQAAQILREHLVSRGFKW